MPVTHYKRGEYTPKMFKDGKAIIVFGMKRPDSLKKPLTDQNPMQEAADICEAGIRMALESTVPLEERIAKFKVSTSSEKKES